MKLLSQKLFNTRTQREAEGFNQKKIVLIFLVALRALVLKK